MPPTPHDVIYFDSPAAFRQWLSDHHATATEQWVGYHKKGTGRPSLTWEDSVDQALCFGWIDGLRKSIDAERYTIRFTPRKPASIWSAVNLARVVELTEQGQMHPAGLAIHAARRDDKAVLYSYENRHNPVLEPDLDAEFRTHPAAWDWFNTQPPGYRHTALWWVISAKRDDTRRKRLATLIENSANQQRLPQFRR